MSGDLGRRIAAVVLVALAAAGTALWNVLAIAERWGRAGRLVGDVAYPCDGQHPAKCRNPLCPAEDTVIMAAVPAGEPEGR